MPSSASKVLAPKSEAASHADFSHIRYAQCWEDADILLDALAIRPGDVCLSIASAGDNALAMLAHQPQRLIAVDLNPAQIACLELRVSAYRALDHVELLQLIGSSTSEDRDRLYRRCRPLLSPGAAAFWDAHTAEIAQGVGAAGKFERYFALFRRRILPLVHSPTDVARLLNGDARDTREAFYQDRWDTWRWRLLFTIFFSRFVMGRLGRDPSFFRYVQGSVANRILSRTKYALTALDPAENPYLQWILTGQHTKALPFVLRPENFESIRNNLDRLEWRCGSLEEVLDDLGDAAIDKFNLSDIFEYMSPENYENLLERLVRSGRIGGRLAYWNMLAERRRPEHMQDRLRPLEDLAKELHIKDKAFFYSDFIVEEIIS